MIVHTYLSSRAKSHWSWRNHRVVGKRTYKASVTIGGKSYYLGEFPLTNKGEDAKLKAEADLLGHLLTEARKA